MLQIAGKPVVMSRDVWEAGVVCMVWHWVLDVVWDASAGVRDMLSVMVAPRVLVHSVA